MKSDQSVVEQLFKRQRRQFRITEQKLTLRIVDTLEVRGGIVVGKQGPQVGHQFEAVLFRHPHRLLSRCT